MEYKVLDKFTYNYEDVKGEENNEPSQTIPDENLSIKEILYRFTNGIVPFSQRELPYDKEGITIDDEVNPINDSELSLSDIHEKMTYHYSRYQDMIELEKQKAEQVKNSADNTQAQTQQ